MIVNVVYTALTINPLLQNNTSMFVYIIVITI